MNDAGEVVFDTGDDGNITISGTINAKAGMYSGLVSVGDPKGVSILIDGAAKIPTISSSNYSDGAGTGWMINSDGDAVFSNVSVRGAIKTAVFEYEEIQAVGGAFLFRPSSTIKTARYNATEITEIDDEGVTTTFETYYHYGEITTIEPTDNPSRQGYYENVGSNEEPIYTLSDDTEVIEGKKYYTKIYNNLIVTVEKPLIFRKNNWVKISNYNELGENPAVDVGTYGLVHIYEVSDTDFTQHPGEAIEIIGDDYAQIVEPTGNPSEQEYYENVGSDEEPNYVLSDDTEVIEGKTHYTNKEVIISPPTDPTYEMTLAGGCAILDYIILDNIPGGALIDFGSHATGIDGRGETIDIPGAHNYGVGINSSDNYVNLPARAISLFETTIHPNKMLKVTYDYSGILGNLPRLPYFGDNSNEIAKVNQLYHDYMEGTQGIYTDNMYIGDHNQYIAFYTDDQGDKHLKISARDIIFGYESGQEVTWEDKIDEIASEVAGANIFVKIESSNGEIFTNGAINTVLTCKVYEGTTDITSSINQFKWIKTVDGGQPIETITATNTLTITTSAGENVSKEVIKCAVTI